MGKPLIFVLRLVLGVVLGFAGIVFGFALIASAQDSTYNSSLASQRALYADFSRIGDYVEASRSGSVKLPDTGSLHTWMRGQSFSSRLIIDNVTVVPSYETCVLGEKTQLPDDGHTYRLCYWNNWTEEFAPETGAHTFALAVGDLKPPWWEIALWAFLALGAILSSFRVLPIPSKSEVRFA